MIDQATLDRVVPKEARRFVGVREQSLDRSCGYASVATLLDLYWDQPTSEQDLLRRWWTPGRGEPLSLSLADVRVLLETSGFDARGYRMDWDQLARVVDLHAPVLVHYDRPQKHFALLLGLQDGWAVTADPARGVETLARSQFEARWSGVALFVSSHFLTRNTRRLESVVGDALERAKQLRDAAREAP